MRAELARNAGETEGRNPDDAEHRWPEVAKPPGGAEAGEPEYKQSGHRNGIPVKRYLSMADDSAKGRANRASSL